MLQLTVHAEDGGGLSDSAELLIEVENLNDNLPNIAAAEIVYLDNGLSSGDVIIDLKVYLYYGQRTYISIGLQYQIQFSKPNVTKR